MKWKMTRASLRSTRLSLLTSLLWLAGCGDQVVIEEINAETGRPVAGEAAQVEDLGDGGSNDGGTPDLEADLYEAAIRNEPNLGPNAPGYIP
ncbi:MAG: hypothetical protein WBG92_00805 [Thiohalocapsa sp.]